MKTDSKQLRINYHSFVFIVVGFQYILTFDCRVRLYRFGRWIEMLPSSKYYDIQKRMDIKLKGLLI